MSEEAQDGREYLKRAHYEQARELIMAVLQGWDRAAQTVANSGNPANVAVAASSVAAALLTFAARVCDGHEGLQAQLDDDLAAVATIFTTSEIIRSRMPTGQVTTNRQPASRDVIGFAQGVLETVIRAAPEE